MSKHRQCGYHSYVYKIHVWLNHAVKRDHDVYNDNTKFVTDRFSESFNSTMTANAPASVTCTTVHLPSLLLCAQITDVWCRHLMYSLALLQ